MNRADKLVKAIKDYIDYLENVDINKIDEFHFIEEFLKVYKIDDVESFSEVTNTSYLMCILMASDMEISFKDLLLAMDNVKEFVDEVEFDSSTYIEYLYSLEKLYNLGIIDKVKNTSEVMKFNQEEMKAYNSYESTRQELFEFENDSGEMVYHHDIDDTIIKLFKILPIPNKYQCFLDLNLASSMIKQAIKNIFDGVLESISLDEYNIDKRIIDKVLSKEKRKIKTRILQDFYGKGFGKQFKASYDNLVNYCASLKKQVKEEVSSINKRMRKLENFVYKLSYVSKQSIIKIDEYDEYLFDPEIKRLFIEYCLEHNLNACKEIEEKNKEYKNNNLNKLELLFTKYGFNFNNLFIEEQKAIIKVSEIKNIEDTLALIKYSELLFLADYHKEFTKLITDTSIDTIKTVDCALKSKIIDKNFIVNNLEILFDEEKYNNLSKNINLLTIYNIDLVNITKKNSHVLMVDNNVLTLIFNILSEYNFTLDKDNNYDILTNENLLDIVDNFIELGLFSLLKENQKYLNKDSSNIVKRIIISNIIGINYINGNNKLIGQVATGNKFYVSPEKYDNYIINEGECYLNPSCVKELECNNRCVISDEIKNSEAIMKLDELYQKSKLVYEINGVTISRNRVLRNLEVLKERSDMDITDVLYQAIIYKMIPNVSDEKLIEIYNSLKLLDLQNNKIYKK